LPTAIDTLEREEESIFRPESASENQSNVKRLRKPAVDKAGI
jgi:hypothetical protein